MCMLEYKHLCFRHTLLRQLWRFNVTKIMQSLKFLSRKVSISLKAISKKRKKDVVDTFSFGAMSLFFPLCGSQSVFRAPNIIQIHLSTLCIFQAQHFDLYSVEEWYMQISGDYNNVITLFAACQIGFQDWSRGCFTEELPFIVGSCNKVWPYRRRRTLSV